MPEKILVIEDDEAILQVLETILNHHNFNVTGISKTDDIIESIGIYNPDIIITDYLLNGLNGGKICQIIKSNAETCHIPVILLTAFIDFAALHGNFGFDGFISKPFEIDDLLKVIRKVRSRNG
jgi:two-component system phosphate regulon response regulator PhoB